MKILKWLLLALLVVLILGFFLGPRATQPDVTASMPEVKIELEDLPAYVKSRDAAVVDFRPGNESVLGWADSIRQTEYALLYLHGFSASPVEGHPVHRIIAKQYGMNLYAPLLTGHGSASIESFVDTNPQDWINDAAEAIAVAQKLGKKIILMSCSTGSTLAVYLSSKFPDAIHAHIMYSPNFDLADSNSKLLTGPWGLQLARIIFKSDYREMKIAKEAVPFWTTKYRLEGLIALRDLLDQTMTEEVWSNFDDPYLIAYYYENEVLKDDIISMDAIAKFNDINSTKSNEKYSSPLTQPKAHVITSPLQSKSIDSVIIVAQNFLDKVILN